MRKTISAFVLGALLVLPGAAAAQEPGSFGIGPRVTFVRGADDSPDDGLRLTGGAIRLGAGRAAIEVAMDYRSEVVGTLSERVKSYPIHGSLLLFPVRSVLGPYLLAGLGWYSQQVTRFEVPTGQFIATEETTRKIGYHAGFGLEVRVHPRLGLSGEYRYTQIGSDDDDDDDDRIFGFIPGAERLKLSHEGSQVVWGATVYF
jgi:hypothetical protein